MRTKKVFGSISQCCHVWAQQSQDEGKCGNVYFQNTTDLYSYGPHYLAARIHTINGQRVALIRSDSYSSSTSGHLSDARSAVNGLMPYFQVPDVRTFNSLENFNYFNDQVIDRVESILKSIKVTNHYDIDWPFDRLTDIVDEANEFFKFAGFPLISIPSELKEILREHLEFRLQRYKELNTPEMIEKRERDKEKREARKIENESKKFQDTIIQWRRGDIHVNWSHLRSLPYKILRVKGDVVQTSGGAEVPLSHALRLLSLIERGQAKVGDRIGHFTLSGHVINGLIRIGCHTIEYSEAKKVLEPYRDQELRWLKTGERL